MKNSANNSDQVKREIEVQRITQQILELSIRRTSLLNEEEQQSTQERASQQEADPKREVVVAQRVVSGTTFAPRKLIEQKKAKAGMTLFTTKRP